MLISRLVRLAQSGLVPTNMGKLDATTKELWFVWLASEHTVLNRRLFSVIIGQRTFCLVSSGGQDNEKIGL